jgi:tetratricopeptide (TPR) repeat protein
MRGFLMCVVLSSFLIPACAKRVAKAPEPVEPVTPAVERTDVERELDAVAEQAALRKEHADVLYDVRMKQARGHQKRFELRRALDAAHEALATRPDSKEALELYMQIQTQLGLRRGSIETEIESVTAREKARREMEVLTIRRKLAEADKLMDAHRYKEARRALEDALFIINTSPYGTKKVSGLEKEIRADLAAARRREAAYRQRRADENLEKALERVHEQGG